MNLHVMHAEPPAPRPMREWDAGKEALQDEAPAERPARPTRPGVPLYQPRPRDRSAVLDATVAMFHAVHDASVLAPSGVTVPAPGLWVH